MVTCTCRRVVLVQGTATAPCTQSLVCCHAELRCGLAPAPTPPPVVAAAPPGGSTHRLLEAGLGAGSCCRLTSLDLRGCSLSDPAAAPEADAAFSEGRDWPAVDAESWQSAEQWLVGGPTPSGCEQTISGLPKAADLPRLTTVPATIATVAPGLRSLQLEGRLVSQLLGSGLPPASSAAGAAASATTLPAGLGGLGFLAGATSLTHLVLSAPPPALAATSEAWRAVAVPGRGIPPLLQPLAGATALQHLVVRHVPVMSASDLEPGRQLALRAASGRGSGSDSDASLVGEHSLPHSHLLGAMMTCLGLLTCRTGCCPFHSYG
jgi:hypothetical protein